MVLIIWVFYLSLLQADDTAMRITINGTVLGRFIFECWVFTITLYLLRIKKQLVLYNLVNHNIYIYKTMSG